MQWLDVASLESEEGLKPSYCARAPQQHESRTVIIWMLGSIQKHILVAVTVFNWYEKVFAGRSMHMLSVNLGLASGQSSQRHSRDAASFPSTKHKQQRNRHALLDLILRKLRKEHIHPSIVF